MKLRPYLTERGVTQRRAAAAIGVNVTTLRRWLSGDKRPSYEHMRHVFDWSFGIVTPNDWVLDASRMVTVERERQEPSND